MTNLMRMVPRLDSKPAASCAVFQRTKNIDITPIAFLRQLQIQAAVINRRQLTYPLFRFHGDEGGIESPRCGSGLEFSFVGYGFAVEVGDVFPVCYGGGCVVYFILMKKKRLWGIELDSHARNRIQHFLRNGLVSHYLQFVLVYPFGGL